MSIKKIIREFFNPRFSTEEIENSRLKCNLSFETTELYYDDEKRGYPTLVLGYVKTRRGYQLPFTWNKYGECSLDGKRIKAFDLVRPTKKQMDSEKPVFTSIAVCVISIIIYAIFK